MDRLQKMTAPIRIQLSDDCHAADGSLTQSAEAGFQLLQQLSASVWAYQDKDRLRLVTRSSTLIARLEQTGSESRLVVEEVAATNPQDVTAAFKDGCKIVAEWVDAGPDNILHSGAATLYAHLTGVQAESPINLFPPEMPVVEDAPPRDTYSSKPPERERITPSANEAPAAKSPGPILPQSEIDLLVQSLLAGQQGAPPTPSLPTGSNPVPESLPPLVQSPPLHDLQTERLQPHPERQSDSANPAGLAQDDPSKTAPSLPTMGYIGAEVETPQQPQEADKNPPAAEVPAAAPQPPNIDGTGSEICLDDWTDTKFTAPAVEQTKRLEDALSAETTALLQMLPSSQPYILIIFANHQLFQHQLPALLDGFNGSIMALWAGETICNRLGQTHLNNLRDLQAKYRSAAAALQKEITRLRQLEQMLPNLQSYRHQQEVVADEILKIAEEMRILRLRQVLQTSEGRFLARKIFDIDSRRYKDLTRLAADSYKMLRRANPSVLSRSHYARTRSRFVNSQRLLEECFERLAKLEKEMQRRLEYQTDWQSLLKRQTIKERELEEIKRFIQSTVVYSPAGAVGDPEAMAKWLKSSWENTKKREMLLHEWQETLTEERAWVSRMETDPLLVLADTSALTLAGITRGAFVILIAEEQTEGMTQAFVGCSEWLLLGLDLKTIGSGKGVTQTTNPVFAAVAELASKMSIEMEEALRTLYLVDVVDSVLEEERQGGEKDG